MTVLLVGCQKRRQSGWSAPANADWGDEGPPDYSDTASNPDALDPLDAEIEAEEQAKEEQAARGGDDSSSSSSQQASRTGARRGGGSGAETEELVLPEDVTQWTPEHFVAALRDDHPQLGDAVTSLGQRSVGNAKIVPLLVGLLAPQDVSESSGSGDGEGGGSTNTFRVEVSDLVVRAIVGALAMNNTPEATNVLKDMLLGKISTPGRPSDLVSDVIKALGANMTPANEAILFVLLTKPVDITSRLTEAAAASDQETSTTRRSSIRRTGTTRAAELSPEWLQEEVINEAAGSSSAEFRTGMATFLDNPQVTAETARVFEAFLSGDDPRNIAAQIKLFQNPQTERQTVQQIEQRLTDNSRQALTLLLGVSESSDSSAGRFSRQAAGRSSRTDDAGTGRPSRPTRRPSRSTQDSIEDEYDDGPDTAPAAPAAPSGADQFLVVQHLWDPSVVEKFQVPSGSNNAEGDRNRSQLPQLLATIPLENARAKLGAMFQAETDPQAWSSMGLFGNQVVDPALLVLAKEANEASNSGRSSRSRRSSSRSDEFDDEPGAQDGWERTIETFVSDLCEQFRAAAERGGGAATPDAGVEPPIRLHRGANVVAQYHVQWPSGLDDRWASVPIAPLDLYYVRVEEQEGRPRSVLSTYKRQMSRADEHELSGGGLWLDSLTKRDRRSIDVRITSEDGDLGLGASRRAVRGSRTNEPVPYVIELLSISIAAPPQPTETAKTAQDGETSG